MINSTDVLIIEDDAHMAELHAHMIRQMSNLTPVCIAPDLKLARAMIKVHKPGLIILDDKLPDGEGLELLKEINADKSDDKASVIFLSGSCYMDAVKKAMQYGCFDYLLKPVALDRMKDTLARYLKYQSMLHAYDSISQEHIDRLFNIQARFKSYDIFPKGINEKTLNKVKRVFYESNRSSYTADTLSEIIGISKTTARRYLEYCLANGFLYAENTHGKIGRPQCIYAKMD